MRTRAPGLPSPAERYPAVRFELRLLACLLSLGAALGACIGYCTWDEDA
jgi:hypothetical protein